MTRPIRTGATKDLVVSTSGSSGIARGWTTGDRERKWGQLASDAMTAPTLRPLAFGEVLDTSFNLFKRNFKTVVTISAAVMVPLSAMGAFAVAGLLPADMAALTDPNADFDDVLPTLLGLYGAIGAGTLLQLFGQILVQAATTRVYAETYQGKKMGISDGLRSGLRRLPAMLVLTVVQTVGFLIGGLLCLIPGIFLYGIWAVSPAALINESLGPFAALRRSQQLVKGFWWRTFGIVIVASILASILAGLLTAPLQVASIVPGILSGDETAVFSGQFLAINVFASGLATALTLPFVAAVVVAVYYDLRVRKEGYDLERLLMDLGDSPGALHPATDADAADPFGLG